MPILLNSSDSPWGNANARRRLKWCLWTFKSNHFGKIDWIEWYNRYSVQQRAVFFGQGDPTPPPQVLDYPYESADHYWLDTPEGDFQYNYIYPDNLFIVPDVQYYVGYCSPPGGGTYEALWNSETAANATSEVYGVEAYLAASWAGEHYVQGPSGKMRISISDNLGSGVIWETFS